MDPEGEARPGAGDEWTGDEQRAEALFKRKWGTTEIRSAIAAGQAKKRRWTGTGAVGETLMVQRGSARQLTPMSMLSPGIESIWMRDTKWSLPSAQASLPAPPKEQRPLPSRCPPFPKGGSAEEVKKWIMECEATCELPEEGHPLSNSLLLSKSKGLQTIQPTPISLKDQQMLLGVANSVVNISSIVPDGRTTMRCTGFIFGDNDSNLATIVTSSYVVCDFHGKLLDDSTLLVHLPNGKSLEGKLVFHNHYYGIAFLEIVPGISLQGCPFASSLMYGDQVFILSRDEELALMTRSGSISCSAQPYLGRNFYMYLDCQLPKCGTGGLVIDKDGNIAGMSVELGCRNPGVLTGSIILSCIEMHKKFRCIARPLLGLDLTAVELLDSSSKDMLARHYCINSGYVVNDVSINSDAEIFGIRRGDVITSFNGTSSLTLPELEEHLLSLGWELLNRFPDSGCKALLKIQFCDLQAHCGRSISLPVGLTCSRLETVINERSGGLEQDGKEENGGSEQDVMDATEP